MGRAVAAEARPVGDVHQQLRDVLAGRHGAAVGRRGEERFGGRGGPVEREAAFHKDEQAVRRPREERARRALDVGHRRLAQALGDGAADVAHDLERGRGVEPRGGLVEEQAAHARRHQSDGDGQALPLAAAQRLDRRVADDRVRDGAEAELVQHRCRAPRRVRRAAQPRGVGDDLQRPQHAQRLQGPVVAHERRRAAHLARDVRAVVQDSPVPPPARLPVREQFEQAPAPAPRGADAEQYLAGVGGEAHVVELEVPLALRQRGGGGGGDGGGRGREAEVHGADLHARRLVVRMLRRGAVHLMCCSDDANLGLPAAHHCHSRSRKVNFRRVAEHGASRSLGGAKVKESARRVLPRRWLYAVRTRARLRRPGSGSRCCLCHMSGP